MIYLCICGNLAAFATQHSPCRITALPASFTQLTWMKGHVDLVIYKIAYLTNDSPYCYPGHFGVLYALPHLVTTFSTRNVTTHVLQSSGRMPQTSLWPRSPNVPCSACWLSLPLVFVLVAVLFSPSSGPNCVEAGWTRRSRNMPEPCCTPQRLPLTQERDPIWFSMI